MKTLQELVDAGVLYRDDESELIKQNLFPMIIEAKLNNTVGRQLVDVINMENKLSSTLDIDLEDVHSHNFNRVVGEGAPYPLDAETYTKVQVTAKKYGHAFGITDEMVEDANWNLVERRMRNAGAEMGRKEDAIIYSALNNATTGIPSEADQSVDTSSTELGIADLNKAKKLVRVQNYDPTVAWIHPTQSEELTNIDTFIEADKLGSREGFLKGLVGQFGGIKFVESTSATENAVFVIDPTECAILAMRKPLFTEQWRDPLRDLTYAKVGQRMASRTLRPLAGAKLTVV